MRFDNCAAIGFCLISRRFPSDPHVSKTLALPMIVLMTVSHPEDDHRLVDFLANAP